jgi:aspartyl aminopeptidase
MSFIDSSPDPFHAVHSASLDLEAAGFVEWKDDVEIVRGGKYYFTRNKSTLVAFAVGNNYRPGNGFKIIGSHTDSPNLKVKPYSKRTTDKNGVAERFRLGWSVMGEGCGIRGLIGIWELVGGCLWRMERVVGFDR